jgi:cytochrome c
MKTLSVALLVAAVSIFAWADMILFEDDFSGSLKEGWSWIRENPEGWRTGKDGLEILVEPGNMWGGANDARNVLVRPLPVTGPNAVEVLATLENYPTRQYEQIDLVWYYDDSHMVKIGLELVHGQLSLVMGREENDKTTTLSIIPMTSNIIEVRFTATGKEVQGEYRTPDAPEWKLGGKCDLPVNGEPKASIQAYQGLPGVEHWARVRGFRITQLMH